MSKKKNGAIIILVIMLIVLGVAGCKIIRQENLKNKEAEINAQIEEIAKQTPTPTATPEPTATPTTTPEPTPEPTPEVNPNKEMDRDINFEELKEENSDIIGWIEIPGTIIDYPIVQSNDNLYYLNHNIKKQKSVYAAIYMDFENNSDFTDRNTVIYGHNMNNGSMFAQLHKFENEDFFDEHKIVKIYTPEGQLNYEVTAAYVRDNKRILFEADFEDDDYFQTYLDNVRAVDGKNDHVSDRMVTINDHIITLSTCVRNQADKRYVVQLVLNNEN